MASPTGPSFLPVIDPVLIALSTGNTAPITTSSSTPALSGSNAERSANNVSPLDVNGQKLSREAFQAKLETHRFKAPLRQACKELQIQVPRKATLARLCHGLLTYWYPQTAIHSPPPVTPTLPPAVSPPVTPIVQSRQATTDELQFTPPCSDNRAALSLRESQHLAEHPELLSEAYNLSEEERLLQTYGTEGAEDLLGYAGDGIDEDDDEDEEEFDQGDPASPFAKFKKEIRMEAANRAEQNRRPGGRKAQQSVVKSWERFLQQALAKGELRDEVVDVDSLLLFIKWSAERPKLNRHGIELPGTRIGASQIKKLFFGALRIRKLQDAEDATLALRRPATSVLVYDAVKERMDQALDCDRNGLLPNEDAQDIIANTFLAEVTQEQLDRIGASFLEHREHKNCSLRPSQLELTSNVVRMAINGHLAWTCQNASGNRGDDFRALKLCELQPYTWTHPNNETVVYSVLGLQGEEKAGKRGMKTKVNPVYSVFIGHRQPELCPLGAITIYMHFLHDYYRIGEKMGIDWTVNKSWRQVRVLFGTSPIVAYNESNLYNLYVQAYKKAGFASKIKVHMPRRLLGYKQEQMGVDKDETSKLGWSRGTFIDTYAPALPKTAILGTHGYKAHENYSPSVRHVHVPERFLALVCPMAEDICKSVAGKEGLVGALNHWSMIIELRKYVFWCGAAIFQKCPSSPIFKLPAFQDTDVRNWMTTAFPSELAAVKALEGNPVDLQRLQNAVLRQALEETRSIQAEQKHALAKMMKILERRTAVLSPTQGFSNEHYQWTASGTRSDPVADESFVATVIQPGVYSTNSGDMRACANPPVPVLSTGETRQVTQVDLVLPPARAFSTIGDPVLSWPPCLGKKGASWKEVFECVKQYDDLWNVWGPSKTLNNYNIDSIWECYTEGEAVYDQDGRQTGMKPPLRLVEGHFQSKWRRGPNERKAWGRLKKIPLYIEEQSQKGKVSPSKVIKRLKDLAAAEGIQGLPALSRRLETLDTLQPPPSPSSPVRSTPIPRLGSPFTATPSSRLSSLPPSSPLDYSHRHKRCAPSPLPQAPPAKQGRW